MTATSVGVKVAAVSDPTSLATVSIEHLPHRIHARRQPCDTLFSLVPKTIFDQVEELGVRV
jgi:hypothetical protein